MCCCKLVIQINYNIILFSDFNEQTRFESLLTTQTLVKIKFACASMHNTRAAFTRRNKFAFINVSGRVIGFAETNTRHTQILTRTQFAGNHVYKSTRKKKND